MSVACAPLYAKDVFYISGALNWCQLVFQFMDLIFLVENILQAVLLMPDRIGSQ